MRACKASKLFLIVVVIHVVVVTVDVADVVADVVAVVSAVENACCCCCCCCGWQLKMSRMLSQLCQREKFRQAWAIYIPYGGYCHIYMIDSIYIYLYTFMPIYSVNCRCVCVLMFTQLSRCLFAFNKYLSH